MKNFCGKTNKKWLVVFLMAGGILFACKSNNESVVKEEKKCNVPVLNEKDTVSSLLKEYEQLINSYASYAGKAKKGDVSALSECAGMAVRINEVEKQLLEKASDLTREEQNKMRELAETLEKLQASFQ